MKFNWQEPSSRRLYSRGALRLLSITTAAFLVATAINRHNYDDFWKNKIVPIQSFGFALLFNSLPTKLSYLLQKEPPLRELQETLDTNYGLFKLVITDCKTTVTECPNQKILYSSAPKWSHTPLGNENPEPASLAQYPYDLLLSPSPLYTEKKYLSPYDLEPEPTGITNKGTVIGRLYYIRFEQPKFLAEYFEWLNPFSETGRDPDEAIYEPFLRISRQSMRLNLERSLQGGLLIWLVWESLLYRKRVRKREEEQQQAYLKAMTRELEIGRQIQGSFLPEKLPQTSGWEFSAYFKPAREVAGDFYDIFPLPGACTGLVIGDVSDKGVGAALFMALFRSLLRVYAEESSLLGLKTLVTTDTELVLSDTSLDQQLAELAYTAPLRAVALTNNYIVRNHGQSNMFATLFFGVLDPVTGVLSYVNGGHEPPVIISPNGIKERLKRTGPAVGMMPDMKFDVQQVHFEPGDIFIGYTDGVTDARDPSGKFFTEKQLLSLLEQTAPTAGSLLDRVEARLRSHIANAAQFDDITMLAVRRA